MDLLYVLGKGSIWADNELKYSLRSVEKHLIGYKNIYIAGEYPPFLKDAIHIKAADGPTKERNIADKIHLACWHPELSEDFLFLNDDFFFLHDTHIENYPAFAQGTIRDRAWRRPIRDAYYHALMNTHNILNNKRKRTNYFDVHTPIIYTKHKFCKMMRMFDWEIPNGYVVKSLYANTFNIPKKNCMDTKVARPMTEPQLQLMTEETQMFSISDEALNKPMVDLLQKLYPNKSKWEK